MSYNKTKNQNEKAPSKNKSSYPPSGNYNRKKKPKEITPTYLHNAGLYYLEHFSTSKMHFKEVMMRKVKRSCLCHKHQNYNSCVKMVDELADKFEKCGLLDDKVYASAMISSMRRKGLSRQSIKAKMRSKGICLDMVAQILENMDDHYHESENEAEIAAAIKFACRKKIGPYFCGTNQNAQKSLGIFSRAGFSYDVAKHVMDIISEDT